MNESVSIYDLLDQLLQAREAELEEICFNLNIHPSTDDMMRARLLEHESIRRLARETYK